MVSHACFRSLPFFLCSTGLALLGASRAGVEKAGVFNFPHFFFNLFRHVPLQNLLCPFFGVLIGSFLPWPHCQGALHTQLYFRDPRFIGLFSPSHPLSRGLHPSSLNPLPVQTLVSSMRVFACACASSLRVMVRV